MFLVWCFASCTILTKTYDAILIKYSIHLTEHLRAWEITDIINILKGQCW